MDKKQKNVKLPIVCRQFIDLETKDIEYLYIALDESKTPIFAISGRNKNDVENAFIDIYSKRMTKIFSKK